MKPKDKNGQKKKKKMGPAVLCILQLGDAFEALSERHFGCQRDVLVHIDREKFIMSTSVKAFPGRAD